MNLLNSLLLLLLPVVFGCRKSHSAIPSTPRPIPVDSLPVNPPTGQDTVAVGEPQYNITPIYQSLGTNIGGFYQALPIAYDTQPAASYPLLIFLHGGGERGDGKTELPWLNFNSIPRLLSEGRFPGSFIAGNEQFSFVVIYPQFRKDSWPVADDVEATLEYALGHYRIDTQRVYIVGMSMGGGATWEYSQQHSDKIAAIVPICGASWPKAATVQQMAKNDLPVWAFHNRGDSTVLFVNSTEKYYNGLKSANTAYPIRLTVWDSPDHDAWTRATNPEYREEGENIYEWMLKHTKTTKK